MRSVEVSPCLQGDALWSVVNKHYREVVQMLM